MEDVDQQIRDEDSLKNLLDLVEASTAVPGIRWCLAANLDGLHAVLSSSRPYFWGAYGFVPSDKTNAVGADEGGWIDLDAINASKALGLRLLEDRRQRSNSTCVQCSHTRRPSPARAPPSQTRCPPGCGTRH